MITESEKKSFQSRGLIQCNNFLPVDQVIRAQKAVFNHLEREGIRRDDTWYLEELSPSNQPNAGASLVKGLKNQKEIGALIGEEVLQTVAELLDGRPSFPLQDRGQILFTLPNAENWTLPHNHWHVDLPRLPEGGIPGVQIFTFLDTVMPGSGGTLVVAGSHRLVNEDCRISSHQVKKILKREPYFRDLMSGEVEDRQRFLTEPVYVGDVELQVVELLGEPGDVFFTDLRLLHTIAPNAAKSPRIMLTQRFLLTYLRDGI